MMAARRKRKKICDKAETALEKENFNEAKLQIDSIRILYPKAFEARKQGVKLMQQVDLKEQQKALDIQVQWALEYHLPLVLHCREAFPELFEVMEPYKTTELSGVFIVLREL